MSKSIALGLLLLLLLTTNPAATNTDTPTNATSPICSNNDDDKHCPSTKKIPTSTQSPTPTPTPIAVPTVLTLPDMSAILSRGLDLYLSGEHIHTTAMNIHSEGVHRLPIAVQLFAIATKLLPFGSQIWTNFGYALMDLAEFTLTMGRGMEEDRVGLLCETVASLEMALALGAGRNDNDDISSVVNDAMDLLLRTTPSCSSTSSTSNSNNHNQHKLDCFQKRCVEPRGQRYATSRRAMQQPSDSSTPSLSLTQTLCTKEMGVTVQPHPYEQARGVLSAATVYEIFALFRFCGVVAVEDLIKPNEVEVVKVGVLKAFEEATPERDRMKVHKGAGGGVEGERLSLRDKTGADARWELKLPVTEPPFRNTNVADNSLLVGLSKLLMAGPNVVVDTLSTVISLPGCPVGHWHGDVEDPFFYYAGLMGNHNDDDDDTSMNSGRHLPPPGVITVIPLLEVGGQIPNGPTEFLMGSHIPPTRDDSDYDWWTRQQTAQTPLVQSLELILPATPGTVILLDIRLRHRGGANRSDKPRPILYLGYTMRWFRDAANFVDPHTVGWAELEGGEARKALFGRLDTQEYTKVLERELVEVYGADYLDTIKARVGGGKRVEGRR
eukprot:CAMPEP_0194096602 /NCGR_PEP_ID=MMETSP0149-20130528/57426_1 /TAXON_ID=122233 /ORGANISM="Chaetoceros debilis, Strain MM31A-1" /LENGTH=608 /DNA_ID=CAMNT_0038782581 /DNA_START=36 /DNA_END=1862 /DNA_ORIENTATION=+